MYMLLPELGGTAESPAEEIPERSAQFTCRVTPRTKVRLGQDPRLWKIFRTMKDTQKYPNVTYIIIRPYRCSPFSGKCVLRIIAVPIVNFRTLTEKHQATSYRDHSGSWHTVILTSVSRNQGSIRVIEEIFAT
jgi:hypothetical protein